MTTWILHLVGVVTWYFHVICLVSTETGSPYRLNQKLQVYTNHVNHAYKPVEGSVQKFADFLSNLPTHTAGDVEKRFLIENKKELAKLQELGNCGDGLLKCRIAGYWAYELVCWPLFQCGGYPEQQFLYYINVNCLAQFPNKNLRENSAKRNESSDTLVLIVGQKPKAKRRADGVSAALRQIANFVNLGAEKDLSIVDELSSCRKTPGREKCTKACDKSYKTLCTTDFTCSQSVLNSFALCCTFSCTYYFG